MVSHKGNGVNVAIPYNKTGGTLVWAATKTTGAVTGVPTVSPVMINGSVVNLAAIPSGATAVAAGASTGELWVTSGHASLADGLILRA